jgi:hypothetical protein
MADSSSTNIQSLETNTNYRSKLEFSLVKSERDFRGVLTKENLLNYIRELEHLKKCSQKGGFTKRIYRNAIFNLQMQYAKTTRNIDIAIEVACNHLDIRERIDNLY